MARWNLSSWLSHSVTQQPYVPATPAAVRGQVYVQELPARFNADVDTQLRFGSGIAYRASRVLHEFVRSSEARALRAQDANAIWVPLYTGFVGRRRILNHASKLAEILHPVLTVRSLVFAEVPLDQVIVLDHWMLGKWVQNCSRAGSGQV